jgi:hypothetical protein
MYKKILILQIFVLCLSVFSAGKDSDAESFLYAVRMHKGPGTWADMQGDAVHKRRGSDLKKSPIHFAIRFTPTQVFAKLLAGKNEGYTIGLFTSSDAERKVSVIPLFKETKENPSILKYYGIRPEDLTMSFLYWDFEKELAEERVSMQLCRVFVLNSPDKNEKVTVYISRKYLFPLKVEWTRAGEKKYYRDLTVSSFRKVNGLWLIDALVLSGPGWRTKITFDKCRAGTEKEGIMKNLFNFGPDSKIE